MQQHRAERVDQGVVGGRPHLRRLRQDQPALHQVRRDELRLPHADAGARQGPRPAQERLHLRVVVPAGRQLPRLRAAARQDLHHQGAAQGPGRRRGRLDPVVFPDGGNETQPGLLLPTTGCHDITVYAEKDIAAGACMGDGVLFDISDRLNPKVTARTTDPNFAFWHSATFSNDARKVVFTDELGGGGAATCNEATGPNRGADAIYEIVKGQLVFKSYFKISRYQADSENCVAHNGSLIPVKGRDIMVQAWYMGGVSIWDFTDGARPREIGYFDRGPRADGSGGGVWSAYYYNGYIYGADFHHGLDVLKISDPLTDSARFVRTDRLNTQTQESYRGRGHGHG
ncbi:putative secreted protein [[Actinomadura] parvosata subsp. kistnae]|nr:putative secreted protein [Actinomadura parvosata subsp. kistnae]